MCKISFSKMENGSVVTQNEIINKNYANSRLSRFIRLIENSLKNPFSAYLPINT